MEYNNESLKFQRKKMEEAKFRFELMKLIHLKESQPRRILSYSRRFLEIQLKNEEIKRLNTILSSVYNRSLSNLSNNKRQLKCVHSSSRLKFQYGPKQKSTSPKQIGLQTADGRKVNRYKYYDHQFPITIPGFPFITNNGEKMKVAGQEPGSVEGSPFFIYNHHYHLFGGSNLETLPEEADNEDEDEEYDNSTESTSRQFYPNKFCDEDIEDFDSIICGTSNRENDMIIPAPSPSVNPIPSPDSSNQCDSNSTFVSTLPLHQSIQPSSIRYEIESQRAKVLTLEATISQLQRNVIGLQEELRESKDQNELLEFRLLELEELSPSSNSQVESLKHSKGKNTDEHLNCKEQNQTEVIPSEITIQGDDGSTNSHSSVTESRSSCSECSESLSLQESGIFFTEEIYQGHSSASGTSSREDLTSELTSLQIQIDSLVKRFTNDQTTEPEKTGDQTVKQDESILDKQCITSNKARGKESETLMTTDMPLEVAFCRKRIENLERHLVQAGGYTYIQGLEDRIATLSHENQRLDEEKAEIEEAANDARRECQRLMETNIQLQQQTKTLQNSITKKQRYVEQLRIQAFNTKEAMEVLRSQFANLEAISQAQEQHNFELEESWIEIKDSFQFLHNFIPVFILWIRSIQKKQNYRLAIEAPKSLKTDKPTAETFATSPFSNTLKVLKFSNEKIDIGIQTESSLEFPCGINHKIETKSEDAGNKGPSLFDESNFIVKSEPLKTIPKNKEEMCQMELSHLQEKWCSLIKELEEFFEVSKGRSLNEIVTTTDLSSREVSFANSNKVRQGTLVANRIKSLFPQEVEPSYKPTQEVTKQLKTLSTTEPNSRNKNDIIQRIQTFMHQVLAEKIADEKREKVLVNNSLEDECSKRSKNLSDENNRLKKLFQEHEEKTWNKIKELEEENDRICNELGQNYCLEKKLDETTGLLKVMRNRVQELEQTEFILEEKAEKNDKLLRKTMEAMQQLKTEIQYWTNKCCQLEDELQLKIELESKTKNEVQVLNHKLKEQTLAIEETESLLTATESSLQSQISKLKTQLKDAQERCGDIECSNGMLREEVLYFEKTLGDVTVKNSELENKIQFLTAQVLQKDEIIKEYEVLMNEGKLCQIDERYSGANDLDLLDKDGGLVGVVREVKEVKALLERCSSCKNTEAGQKLNEVTEQLNTLTLVIEGSQDDSYRKETLSRCESEEFISNAFQPHKPKGMAVLYSEIVEENKGLLQSLADLKSVLEEKEQKINQLRKHQETLGLQIQEMETNFLRQQRKTKESSMNETFWWRLRCEEKNDLLQILSKKIAHLSATDIHGYFLEGIVREIRGISKNYPSIPVEGDKSHLDSYSLLNYFTNERQRITEVLESVSCDSIESQFMEDLDFRVLRKLGSDSLLCSFNNLAKYGRSENIDGYEVSVNGDVYIKIPNPTRYKVILFGLDMEEPLHLSLRSTGEYTNESSITYIA